ncbi:hypothetical protein C0Q70_07775 [Pomacea canaliculata]|uniref:SSD domain-containing protein n=1 Tax=Pomacea canaliculata TaxID=400727 RepID=A0A2T7PG00_POMCA|nr:hypothetical protein C0Q70_07775 [Pomacea canaliculata]
MLQRMEGTPEVPRDGATDWGTRLVYAAIVVNTTLKVGTLGYSTGIPIVEAWDDFFKNQVSVMPSSLAGGFQCTPESGNPWHGFYVQKVMLTRLIRLTSLSLSFQHYRQYIYIHQMLSVLESLNLSLVVGLSVDYVVHLAEGYHSSTATNRLDRTRDMLDHVGISILSGAITTLGAAVFMCGAVILFFMQFGIFMFATIGFSLFFALLGFSVIMALVGPQKQTGSLVPVFWWVRYKLRGRKSHHVTCKQCEGKGFHGGLGEDSSQTSGAVAAGSNVPKQL